MSEIYKLKLLKEPEKLIGSHVIHTQSNPIEYKDGKWNYKVQDRAVILMAIVGKYVMVRRPRSSVPYVADINSISAVWPYKI